jgi:hypothetical protein
VLDTSFWAVGFKVGILGYALRTFTIVVPDHVEAELCHPDALYPTRLYPDSALFEQVRPLLQAPPAPCPPPLGQFGKGEAAAIALAAVHGFALLINDSRPAAFARNMGVANVVTVPGMVVLARAEGLLGDHQARAMLRACSFHGTSPSLLAEAELLLDALV